MLNQACLGLKQAHRLLPLIFAAGWLHASDAAALEQSDCDQLLGNDAATLISSELIAAADSLPAHCHVVGRIPAAVHFELRLPERWNGKFLMVGNGGYLGTFFDQSYGLARGYATASTDTGHEGPDPRFALNNRDAEIDFAYRAVHVSAQAARDLIKAYYGRPPRYAYFRGCSTGGRQGMIELQRYPEDFDGWSIGAPVYDYTDKQIYNAAWVAQALFGNDRKGYVPHTKLQALGTAVYARCDAIDGLGDGIIDDPRRCAFDPALDLQQCAVGEAHSQCFTAAQIDAITKIYAGPGEDLYPGHVLGAEWLNVPANEMSGGWDTYLTGILKPPADARNTIGQMDRDPYGGDEFIAVQLRNAGSFFKYLAFERDRPDYDVLTDLDFAEVPDTSFMAAMMNATDTDLRRANEMGKKVLLWHGWADVGLNPLRTIQYYEAVQEALSEEQTDGFLRLFMVPGMYHCEGGPGPDRFDDLTALEDWVESGIAPDRIVAYKTTGANAFYPDRRPASPATAGAKILRSRPLCVYPKVARHRGQGSIDAADSFACVEPFR